MDQALTVATIKEAQKKAQRGPQSAFAAGAGHWFPKPQKSRKRQKK